MGTLYQDDVIAWARQQAALLRAGHWSQLDIDNIAEEIEDVGNRERQALRSHLVVLLVHLLKWQFQPSRRSRSWSSTIATQRAAIEEALEDFPSLQPLLSDPQWLATAYRRAVRRASAEAGLRSLPAVRPWTIEQVLSLDYLPS